MKHTRFFPALMLLVITIVNGFSAQATPAVRFEIIRSDVFDLAYHIFAHMDIGRNAASVYDAGYVTRMAALRRDYSRRSGPVEITDLRAHLKKAADAMGRDQQLMSLYFLPMSAGGVDDYLAGLAHLAGFPGGKMSRTMTAMAEKIQERNLPAVAVVCAALHHATVSERAFFSAYSKSQSNGWNIQQKSFEEMWMSRAAPLLSPYLGEAGVDRVRIVLSEAMRHNGRGFQGTPFMVAARLPSGPGERMDPFFTAAHEITHLFTDPVVEAAGHDLSLRSTAVSGAGFRIHQYVEGCAMLADLYLFSRHAELYREYVTWMERKGMRVGKGLDNQAYSLARIFGLSGDLSRAVKQRFAP